MDKPNFYMLVGLPGSGKSTYTKEHLKGAVVCSSDSIREELTGDINSQDCNEEVFRVLHQRVKENLKAGKDVVYDACNISSKRRKAFVDELKKIECKKVCALIVKPYGQCVIDNMERERRVPEEVIKRMYLCWNTPFYFEGWDRIYIVNHSSESKEISNNPYWEAINLSDFQQDNLFHTHTLGLHLIETYNNIVKLSEHLEINRKDLAALKMAALLHDTGKPFTKTFLDSNGNKCSNAHYYRHENVGAYDVLVNYKSLSDAILHISILVNLHMRPYCWGKAPNSMKARENCLNLWGKDLFNQVMLLHAADRMSH